jgi:hypothetical protein
MFCDDFACKLKVSLGRLRLFDQSHDLHITSFGSIRSGVKWIYGGSLLRVTLH